jgi:hypothetical protein
MELAREFGPSARDSLSPSAAARIDRGDGSNALGDNAPKPSRTGIRGPQVDGIVRLICPAASAAVVIYL